MANNFKKRSAAIQVVAQTIVDGKLADSLHDEERRILIKGYAEEVAWQAGCTYATARNHVFKALRRQRHPGWTEPQAEPLLGWGGQRPGAGKPKTPEHAVILQVPRTFQTAEWRLERMAGRQWKLVSKQSTDGRELEIVLPEGLYRTIWWHEGDKRIRKFLLGDGVINWIDEY